VAPISFLETGVIYCDDNLHRLAQFPAESVDLIYLDPPFFSNRQYEVIWGDEAEVRSFEDRWQGGIHVYIEWMRERVIELHRILKPSGSLFLHCDWHAAHYLKVMLDDVFEEANFCNDIIWHYRRWTAPSKRLQRLHDDILWYAKDYGQHTYNTVYVPAANVEKGRKESYREDESGRMVREQSLRGVRYEIERDPRGVHAGDVWYIPFIHPSAKERLGYPTQKPEELMLRLVEAGSNRGDTVLDPFAGCGTTLVAAQRLGREWIGIDVSPTAVELMSRRMAKIGVPTVKLIGMPVTEAQLHALKPFEFQNWVIQRMNGTHSPRKSGDMGIDGFSFFEHLPIQVKQSGVGRPTVDAFQTAIDRTGKKRGYIVGFSFSRDAHEEAARAKAKGITIELLKVADLLAGKADLVTPETGLFTELPLPEPRTRESRPSVEELVASDEGRKRSRAAEEPAPYDSDDSN